MSNFKATTHCIKCGDELYVLNAVYSGTSRRNLCKKCYGIQRKERGNTPENKRRIHAIQIKNRYGVTVEEYETLLKLQSGKCAICEDTDNDNLCVDHNHTTNQVRGLLCRKCNNAIGLTKENLD